MSFQVRANRSYVLFKKTLQQFSFMIILSIMLIFYIREKGGFFMEMLDSHWRSYKIKNKIIISEMITFFTEIFAKGHTYKGESHNFWECFYVIKGEARVTANERLYKLKTGDIIFHNPLTLHKFTITGEHGANVLFFSFSMTGEKADFFTSKVFHLQGYQRDIIMRMLTYAQNCRDEFLLTNSIESVELSGDYAYLIPSETMPNYMHMISTFLYQLFLSLLDDNVKITNSVSSDSQIFSNSVRFMNDRLSESLSIEEIAKINNISESGLKRIFNKYAGMGVHKYFLMLKLNAATELLKYGYSVNKAADKLGFSSQAYFSKAYKREFGIAPTAINKDKKQPMS